jgi:hypothetical protein
MIYVRSIMSMALLRGREKVPFGFLEKSKLKREKNIPNINTENESYF